MAFNLKKTGDIAYLQAPNLENFSEITHGFTTRLGGFSKGQYKSLNLALHVGDDPEAVLLNRSRVAQIFGCQQEDSVSVRQVHGTKVQQVVARDRGQGAKQYDTSVPEGDALVTNVPGIFLWCFVADCVPVLFYDPQERVIAAVHAGWRGTQARIVKETIQVMKNAYSCKPENIQGAIGPSVGPCCYEVGKEVADMFSSVGLTAALKESDKGTKLNLWQANEQVMLECGMLAENIVRADLCTSCFQELFFSFRGENGTTGRFAAAIYLKK